jgi:hypothetical protein
MGGSSWYVNPVYPTPSGPTDYQKRKERQEQKRKEIEHKKDVDGIMNYIYQHFRDACATLEETIERHDAELSEKDKKRLDKAITVMKVGFKIMKFVLRKRKHLSVQYPLTYDSALYNNDGERIN